ncbi:head GIN domain-containing protein [Gilvibacter sediminis]|uniref:head GIN domain-containing protein n=1 Tax=Gilvibacter sediminis TaxID=379071 RepID=UPI0023507C4C|nr:head GIN domain-containing protein [Gilvibacter sediminis]MDC7998684.1 DUF2807 domain-containing protein [Gilvibacter sediminis]
MKQLTLLIISVSLLLGCSSSDAPDCIQAAGDLVTKEFTLSDFQRIRIEDGVRLVIRQADTYQVVLESGEFIIDDISVRKEDDLLVVANDNRCNFVREYGLTTVYVDAPNITQIRNSSRFEVRGEGVLQYPSLTLLSNTSGEGSSGRKSGDFFLDLQVNNLRINANGISVFYISGSANNAFVQFSDEQPRLEGRDLLIQDLEIVQVSANKMIVNPQQSIIGVIRGTGDVISVNTPPLVEVEELFTGTLIFED